jgi:hypothetical protein
MAIIHKEAIAIESDKNLSFKIVSIIYWLNYKFFKIFLFFIYLFSFVIKDNNYSTIEENI